MWFVVAFLSSELDVIVESSTVSIVIQTFEFVIVVLSIVVPLSSDAVAVMFVKMLLLYIVEVVRSDSSIVESLMLEVVVFDSVIVEVLIFEFVSIVESFIVEFVVDES